MTLVIHLTYNKIQRCCRYKHYRQCDRHRGYVPVCLQTATLCFRIHTSIQAVSSHQCHWQVAILVLCFHSHSPFLTIQFFLRANHDKIIRSQYPIPSTGSPRMPNSSCYQKHGMGCGFNHAESDVRKIIFGFNSHSTNFSKVLVWGYTCRMSSLGRSRSPPGTAYELLRRDEVTLTPRSHEHKTHAWSSWMWRRAVRYFGTDVPQKPAASILWIRRNISIPKTVTATFTVTSDKAVSHESVIKVKAIPVEAWTGPECSGRFKLPDSSQSAPDGGEFVCLTHWPPLSPPPPRKYSWHLLLLDAGPIPRQ